MATTDLSTSIESSESSRRGLRPLQWLRWPFEPHPSLTDDLSRRRSQLLTGMLAITAFVAIVAIAHTVITRPHTLYELDTWAYIGGVGMVLSALVMNRVGQVNRAAKLFVGLMIPLFTVVPLVADTGDHTLTFFALLPILVSGIFFSVQATIWIAVSCILIITGLALSTGAPLMPSFFLTISAGVVYLFIKHLQFQESIRTRELEVMNQRLRESEESLEQRVQERTRDLQVAADVSLQVTTQLDTSRLLADVTERTASAFNLYHVSIFLYDEADSTLRLKQGIGEAGALMVRAGKQFRLAQQGLVPTAARTMQAALANDVAATGDYYVNPLLPETRAELAIPIIYRGQLLGVLDLQSAQDGRFGDEDIRIMRTLAEQIGVAIRNSQLFEETTSAREAAERADRVKSAFLASMSHELRTPLNAIINFSKFLKKGIPGPVNDEQEQLIGSIADSGQHLLNLINDVLDMSKIEAGSLKLYIEPDVDLGEVMRNAIRYTMPLLADKPVTLCHDIPDDLPLLTGDRKRLLQIGLNILSNAAKFTEDGHISVRIEHLPDHLRLSVEDTGAGIAPEDAEYVFTAFKQTESGLRQGGGGTGLGMPICQKLVEAHDGRIWFESQPGSGTTFYVELPLQPDLEAERS